MEPLKPDHYWKTPFIWEPGCPLPPATPSLRFEAVDDAWLLPAVAQVMSDSLDESDKHVVGRFGPSGAVADLFAFNAEVFEKRPGWWTAAVDDQGRRVGFVLPVLFRREATWKDGRPEGTIFYMGVLPGFRGHRYALELLAQATRVFIAANCWRIFCDTGTDNSPMVRAFRQAGYKERAPWQRSIA
jgi:ribosomal protein S18 acetylase RimI-like enzyme